VKRRDRRVRRILEDRSADGAGRNSLASRPADVPARCAHAGMGVGIHVAYPGELGGRLVTWPRRDTDWFARGGVVFLSGPPRALFGGTRKRGAAGIVDPVISCPLGGAHAPRVRGGWSSWPCDRAHRLQRSGCPARGQVPFELPRVNGAGLRERRSRQQRTAH